MGASRLRRASIAFLLVTVVACPMLAASYSIPSSALAHSQFGTVPPVSPDVPTPIGESGPVPTPLPTLEPGQYFEADDPNRPPIDPDGVVGDSKYGYMELAGEDGLYLVWMTDELGTHYLVVDENSELLTGGSDPASGFFELAARREELAESAALTRDQQATHQRSARNLRWGTIAILGGALGCVLITAGACGVVIAAAAVPFWASLGQDTDANLAQDVIQSSERQLSQEEGQMRFQFRVAQATAPGN